MKNSLKNLKQVFINYELLEIMVLGVISGMPLAVIASSIKGMLTDMQVAIEIVTTFAIAKISYSLKPLWSPLVDYYSIPILNKFGHRKSWLILCTTIISILTFMIAVVNDNISTLYLLAILIGFSSATFDINCDALRIMKFEDNLQGLAVACNVFGYRIGMLISGAGALYIAHILSWKHAFVFISIIFFIGAVFIITIKEKGIKHLYSKKTAFNFTFIIKPFKEFFSRKFAIIILISIIFFKIGDAMLHSVSLPFYLMIGFSKEQIALGVKVYGLIATIVGSYAGGYVIYKIKQFNALIIAVILQSVTNIAFIWLYSAGAKFDVLIITITLENLASGMGTSVLVTYISNLCNKEYSATQYAILSSAASLCNNTLTVYSGLLVKILGWNNFFVMTIFLGIPSIILFYYLHIKTKTRVN